MPRDEHGDKWACESCCRGHRSSKCEHFLRIMARINKPGRPLGKCTHPPGRCTCNTNNMLMVRIGHGSGPACLCRPVFTVENGKAYPVDANGQKLPPYLPVELPHGTFNPYGVSDSWHASSSVASPSSMPSPNGMHLPGNMHIPDSMSSPIGMPSPGGMHLPGSMPPPGSMPSPNGMEPPGSMYLRGSMHPPANMHLPANTHPPANMHIPVSMPTPTSVPIPMGMQPPTAVSSPTSIPPPGSMPLAGSMHSLGGMHPTASYPQLPLMPSQDVMSMPLLQSSPVPYPPEHMGILKESFSLPQRPLPVLPKNIPQVNPSPIHSPVAGNHLESSASGASFELFPPQFSPTANSNGKDSLENVPHIGQELIGQSNGPSLVDGLATSLSENPKQQHITIPAQAAPSTSCCCADSSREPISQLASSETLSPNGSSETSDQHRRLSELKNQPATQNKRTWDECTCGPECTCFGCRVHPIHDSAKKRMRSIAMCLSEANLGTMSPPAPPAEPQYPATTAPVDIPSETTFTTNLPANIFDLDSELGAMLNGSSDLPPDFMAAATLDDATYLWYNPGSLEDFASDPSPVATTSDQNVGDVSGLGQCCLCSMDFLQCRCPLG